jgi:hypothetical protein
MNFPKPSNIAYEADILEKVTKALLEVNVELNDDDD